MENKVCGEPGCYSPVDGFFLDVWYCDDHLDKRVEHYRETHCADCEMANEDCECEPPDETGEPENGPRDDQERQADAMRYKR